MGSRYVPNRGDVVWLSFDPQAGREQAGHRPALVLSPARYNSKIGLALVCPITSKAKGYPFEVAIPGGFPVQGVVLSDHVKSIDWISRRATFSCHLPEDAVEEVRARIETLMES